MRVRKNLLGNQYGSLLIIEFSHFTGTHSMWVAICDVCLKKSTVSATNLESGNTGGCRYCKDIRLGITAMTHGLSYSRLYNRWQTLKDKGVLCAEWNDFKTFYDDVHDLFEEGYSLRRLDTSKPHSVDNSYWVMPRISISIPSVRIYFNNKNEEL